MDYDEEDKLTVQIISRYVPVSLSMVAHSAAAFNSSSTNVLENFFVSEEYAAEDRECSSSSLSLISSL